MTSMGIRVVLALTALLVLAGCGQQGAKEEPRQTGQEESALMPETMPDDFAFKVRYGITAKNEIDAFEGTVTKDLIANGTATAGIRFTQVEMKAIYDEMRKVNVFGNLKLWPDKQGCMQTPYEEEYWTIRAGGKTVNLHWSGEHCGLTQDALRLQKVRSIIFNIVKDREAYRRLPEPEGGYD